MYVKLVASFLHGVRKNQIDAWSVIALSRRPVCLPLLSISPSGSGVRVGMVLGGDCAHFPCSARGSSLWVAMFQGLVLLNVD